MIHLIVTDRIRQTARRLAEPLADRYARNSDSIRSGDGHYYGKIGELCTAEHLGWKFSNTYDNDLEAVLESGQTAKVEVKVKQRSVRPKLHYIASVAAANTRQDCDFYLFCSTIGDREVFIVGYLNKADFLRYATFRRQGEPDDEGPPGAGWKFRADCYNIPYAALRQMGEVPLEA